jgi:polyferredoxin
VRLARIRRLSQIVFLALFLLLLMRTEFRGSLHVAADEIRLPWPVGIFLEADPLAALLNALSAHALYTGLLWSLVILIPTLFLGRFFCGWICPLGTLNHFFSSLGWGKNRGRRRIESHHYQSWQRWKYYVLVAALTAAVFGSTIGAWFDPISLAVRSIALSVLPAANYGANAAIESLPRIPAAIVHFLLKDTVLSFRQPHFSQGLLFGLIFITILALNLWVTRFWCRALCPLGALLGVASRWSLIGLRKPRAACVECNRCLLNCQGGDEPAPGATWRKAECHLCMNCVADCPGGELKFAILPQPATTLERVDLRRRAAFVSFAGGAAVVPLLRTNQVTDPRLIRPPGAREENAFLERCIRCGECMKVCPNNALHPALAQAGVEGFWTPVLIPRSGYCEPSCTLCSQVCPSGAIRQISGEEKGWVSGAPPAQPKIRIGTAFYDRGRCLPWAMATECIVCEEWCPASPKAIYLRPAEMTGSDGRVHQVRQPYVDPDLCVGCGACEYACPVRDTPAVYVTSAGESRSRTNQFLLSRPRAAETMTLLPGDKDAPGWARSGTVRTFDAATLWQYIDGGAEKYIQYGFDRVLTAAYRYHGQSDAAADLYAMLTADAARKLFESESSAGARAITLGDAARLYGASLVFRRGRYLVRLTAYEESPETPAALSVLARAIDDRLVTAGVK